MNWWLFEFSVEFHNLNNISIEQWQMPTTKISFVTHEFQTTTNMEFNRSQWRRKIRERKETIQKTWCSFPSNIGYNECCVCVCVYDMFCDCHCQCIGARDGLKHMENLLLQFFVNVLMLTLLLCSWPTFSSIFAPFFSLAKYQVDVCSNVFFSQFLLFSLLRFLFCSHLIQIQLNWTNKWKKKKWRVVRKRLQSMFMWNLTMFGELKKKWNLRICRW